MNFMEFIADKPLIIALSVLVMTIAVFYIVSPKGHKKRNKNDII